MLSGLLGAGGHSTSRGVGVHPLLSGLLVAGVRSSSRGAGVRQMLSGLLGVGVRHWFYLHRNSVYIFDI